MLNNKSLTLLLITFVYFLWVYFFVGIRPDHISLITIVLISYFVHPFTKKIITAFFIFIAYWVIYDSMRVFPNYLVNDIHIVEPYQLEKSIFGIQFNNNILSPNEYFLATSSTTLDVMSGLFYINWVPIPLLFATYLFFKNKFLLLQFFGAFLVVNLIGFIGYYAFPAAPPWYYAEYGNQVLFNTPGNCAGLANFDAFFNIDLFHSLYEKNANVFAAMPSLHASYPIIVLIYAIKQKIRLGIIIFVVFLAGIWFSAVYSGHHYVIDLLAGGICALMGIFLFDKILLNVPKINNWLLNYSTKI